MGEKSGFGISGRKSLQDTDLGSHPGICRTRELSDLQEHCQLFPDDVTSK